MRRDELVLPERRWPYLSTRAPAPRAREPPDFATLHKSLSEPAMTVSAELRRATVEEHEMKRQHHEKRLERESARRKAKQDAATRAVARALSDASGRDVKEQEQARQEEQKRRFDQEAKERAEGA